MRSGVRRTSSINDKKQRLDLSGSTVKGNRSEPDGLLFSTVLREGRVKQVFYVAPVHRVAGVGRRSTLSTLAGPLNTKKGGGEDVKEKRKNLYNFLT